MSDTYVTMKTKEALIAAQGSRAQAMRLLVAWALADEQLLRGLCKPFLPAIAGSAVDRMAKGKAATAAAPPRTASGGARAPVKRKLDPKMLDAIINRMGQGPAPAAPASNGAASQLPDFDDPADTHQADALKALAASFKPRR